MTRDNFTAATKQALAARVGNRCSLANCRRTTSKPHPTETDRFVNAGVAAHITAASPGGPRYDASLDAAARRHADNGIWLCELCAKAVDAAQSAFTVEGLKVMKRHAEVSAARDSTATPDTLRELISLLDETHRAIVTHAAYWDARDSWPATASEDWDAMVEEMMKQSRLRRGAYASEIAPRVMRILTRASAVLGDSPALDECTRVSSYAATNLIGTRRLADSLQRLRVDLELR